MRCHKLRSLLPAYCNRELKTSVTSVMERHFHECEKCREDLAAHRLIATTITTLADSAPNENHAETLSSAERLTESKSLLSVEHPFEESFKSQSTFESQTMSTPSFKPLQVSADFNNKLMERIAQERFAETRSNARSKAFLPQKAPSFVFRRLVPALASVTAVAALAVVSLQQGVFDNADSNNQFAANDPTPMAFIADNQALNAPAIGKPIGLSEEYMTAQPIDNPLYDRSLIPAGNLSAPSSAQGATMVSATSPRQLSSSRRWHFARDYARARRIISISNALCRRGAYFKVVQFDANGAPIGTGSIVFCGPSSNNRVAGSPQIIVQPIPNAPVRNQAPQGRMVRGSF